MTSSIGLCLGAVTVISALILGHPLSVLTVIIVLGAWAFKGPRWPGGATKLWE